MLVGKILMENMRQASIFYLTQLTTLTKSNGRNSGLWIH
jgi:hypothetical protein